MKLSTAAAKLTCMKSKAVRVLAAATFAGAVLTAAAPAAQAQHVSFGVQVGTPRYYEPAPPVVYGYNNGYGNGYYERERIEAARRRQAWERQQEFYRHQQWERDHRFHDYGYRNHDGYDRDGYHDFHGR